MADKMTKEVFDRAADDLRPRLQDYLISKGIPLGKTGKQSKAFLCLNPNHPDRKPSMVYYPSSQKVHCFSCNASYDLFDLIGIDYNLSSSRQMLEKAAEIYHYDLTGLIAGGTPSTAQNHNHIKTEQPAQEQPKDYFASGAFKRWHDQLSMTDYPQRRCLSAEVLEKHMIGFMPEYNFGNGRTYPVMIIPTGKSSYVARNTSTGEVSKSDRYRDKGGKHIFNAKAIAKADRPIFIVQGEIDAMSIESVGGIAVGMGGKGNVRILLEYVKQNRPSQPMIIALDKEADEAKQKEVDKAAQELQAGLKELDIPFYRRLPQGNYHDANEALLADREAFAEAVASVEHIEEQAFEDAKEQYFRGIQTSRYLGSFMNGITQSVNTPSVSTGFAKLDSVLDGGLYEGLHIVGAISSLGKTTLVLQIADQIAASGHDVIIFSLEMGRTQLIAKSVSRHTAQLAEANKLYQGFAKTARGITDGRRYAGYRMEERQLIKDSIAAYSRYADHIFIQQGMGDVGAAEIRNTVEQHILYTGGKWVTDEETGKRSLIGGHRPVVVVDYMQILAPYSERMTDKQNTDKSVVQLRRISRDYKIPLIGISSLNRANYSNEVSMEAFKESGAIEYGADVLIGLQLKGAGKKDFNPTEAKSKNPRQVQLVILKNRQAKVGLTVSFLYYAMFNRFKEA